MKRSHYIGGEGSYSTSLDMNNLLISSPKNAKKANTSDDELPAHLRKKKAPVKILDDYLTCEKGPYLWPNDKGMF